MRNFKFTGKENQIIIQQHKEGKYEALFTTFKLIIHGLPFDIKEIEIDNEVLEVEFKKENNIYTMNVIKDFSEIHIIGT